MLCCKDVRNS